MLKFSFMEGASSVCAFCRIRGTKKTCDFKTIINFVFLTLTSFWAVLHQKKKEWTLLLACCSLAEHCSESQI